MLSGSAEQEIDMESDYSNGSYVGHSPASQGLALSASSNIAPDSPSMGEKFR